MAILCVMSLFATKIKQAEIQLLGKNKTMAQLLKKLQKNRRNYYIIVLSFFMIFVVSCTASIISGFSSSKFGTKYVLTQIVRVAVDIPSSLFQMSMVITYAAMWDHFLRAMHKAYDFRIYYQRVPLLIFVFFFVVSCVNILVMDFAFIPVVLVEERDCPKWFARILGDNWYVFSVAMNLGSLMLLNAIFFIATNLDKISMAGCEDNEEEELDCSQHMTNIDNDTDPI